MRREEEGGEGGVEGYVFVALCVRARVNYACSYLHARQRTTERK